MVNEYKTICYNALFTDHFYARMDDAGFRLKNIVSVS